MEENKELNADCVINTLTDGADKPEVKLTEKMQAEVKRMAKEYIIPKLDYTLTNYNAYDMMEAFEEGYKTAMSENPSLTNLGINENQGQVELSDEDKENFEWFDKLFRAESVVLGGREIPQEKYYWFKSLRPHKRNSSNE